MRTLHNTKDSGSFLEILNRFDSAEYNSYLRSESLSSITMPTKVLESIAMRMGLDKHVATRAEYLAHLEEILRLLHEYPNFHINLMDRKEWPNYSVYVKDNFGTIIIGWLTIRA